MKAKQRRFEHTYFSYLSSVRLSLIFLNLFLRYSDVEVTNLTASWEDGRAFLALLNDANPSEAPYRPVSDAILNRKKAYRLGEELFGVPQLLNYQDARVFHYEQVRRVAFVAIYSFFKHTIFSVCGLRKETRQWKHRLKKTAYFYMLFHQ